GMAESGPPRADGMAGEGSAGVATVALRVPERMVAQPGAAAEPVPAPRGGSVARGDHPPQEAPLELASGPPRPLAKREEPQLLPGTRGSQFSSLVPLKPGTGTPLFLVHSVGGNVLCYAELSRCLESGPVFGLQSIGFAAGSEPHKTIEEMAAFYVDTIRTVTPHGPYRLGGWSMGGLIAYEAAQLLAADGEPVELLALLDTMAPVPLSPDMGKPDEAYLLAGMALDLGQQTGRDLGVTAPRLRWMRPEKRLQYVLDRARATGALPAEMGAGAIRLWRVFLANASAGQVYRPASYHGRVLFLAASRNATREHLGPALGWERFALGGLDLDTYDTGHWDLLRYPTVRAVAERLDRASRAASVPTFSGELSRP
ncbi:MAG: thioesterase domain-containing protein, partial [Acidobacteriota bacterium]|nr:thioesterase domain-containing protein [Acidobacteriota bacterium]